MLIVIALGGNALLQRGEPLEAELLQKNSAMVAKLIAQVATNHQVVITHGNGPQVGLLALQAEAYKDVKPYPFDMLGAQTQGMIGYVLQQAIDNNLSEKIATTLLTQVVVDENDPAFENPTKFIGPVYNKDQADQLSSEHNWVVKPDGKYFRRVVPSPRPQAIHELKAIKTLLADNNIVIAGGGGGAPCIENETGKLKGIEAVIDKDLTASLIAHSLGADQFIILTDVKNVYEHYGTDNEKAITKASPDELMKMDFAKGSMGPKIKAACEFASSTGKPASIGHLSELIEIIAQKAGTLIQ